MKAPVSPTSRVVVYVSVDEQVARTVLDEFEARSGIEVHLIGDSEASKTTGLVQRLRAEHDAPIADVFWSSEAMQTIALSGEGVLAEYDDVAWPRSHRDEGGRWFAFSPRPRVTRLRPAATRSRRIGPAPGRTRSMAASRIDWSWRTRVSAPRADTWPRWSRPGRQRVNRIVSKRFSRDCTPAEPGCCPAAMPRWSMPSLAEKPTSGSRMPMTCVRRRLEASRWTWSFLDMISIAPVAGHS